MKKNLLSLLAFGALVLAGCTSEEPLLGPNGGTVEGDGRYAFINTTIALPTNGGRSATDEGQGETNSNGSSNSGNTDTDSSNPTEGSDFEYGYAYENDVRSMILVITDENDKYLTHLTVTGMTQASETGQQHIFTQIARIPFTVLEDAYQPGGLFETVATGGPKIRLYAFCNFTQNMFAQFEAFQQQVATDSAADLTAWRDFYGGVEEKASQAGQVPQSTNSIWSARSFLMANSEVYETVFPEDIDAWDQYADDKHPLQLSSTAKPIKVERVAARLDFRDASENHDQIYKIWVKTALFTDDVNSSTEPSQGRASDAPGDRPGEKNLFSVKLSRMSLVNMSKHFYYLRRVSNDGTNNNPLYCGLETPNNYVVDYNWSEKQGVIDVASAPDYFNFPVFDETGNYYNNMNGTYGWYTSNINKDGDATSVLKGNPDNWDGSSQFGDYGYHIWRYVTENTLPGIDVQQTVQSTGIIFKAAILPGEDIDARYNVDASSSEGGERYVSEAVKDALNAVADQPQQEPDGMPAIYSFNNMLYAGVKDIVEAAKKDGNGGSLYFAVDQILKNWYMKGDSKKFEYSATPVTGNDVTQLNVIIADEILNGTEVTDGSIDYTSGYSIDFADPDAPANLAKFDNSRFIELAPDMKITVFIPTKDDTEGWGYYCYYFYWNRHNDNGLNGKMGKMEFATVRNNVYKLAVTKINSIGRPRDTSRDPDPVKPDDPDEEPERSIEVAVEVLPWVVRVNDIEF